MNRSKARMTGPARASAGGQVFNPWGRWGLVVLACSLAGGCVKPEEIEPSLIARYQAALQEQRRSRAHDQGADLLRPVDGGEPLKVVRDPATDMPAVELSLNEAVRMALRNSMDIRVVAYDPAISREEMVKAAAAFDAVAFASISKNRTDRRPSAVTGGAQQDTVPLQAGLRDRLVAGTDVELTWDITHTRDNNAFTVPEPRYESLLSAKATHPLLRGGGIEYNLAALRVAALNTKIAYSQFRQRVEEIVAAVHTGYWTVVQARRELAIQQELLDRTIETRDRVSKRRDLDATQVEIKQAEAAAESRRAVLVRAKTTVLNAQEELSRLLGDPRVNVLGKYAIVPTTPPVVSQVTIDAADQLVTALRFSPPLEQARLNIAASDIRVGVAKNETLPSLNLTASTGIDGLKDNLAAGVKDMLRFNYIDYSIGLAYEQPIGNRAALAALKQRRFERLKAIADMQNVADKVALNVNETIRQVYTTHEEVKAQQASKEASRIQLQALEDTEKIRGQLTPEFLQLKLQAQETLATAERAEIAAVVNFNNALAQLAQVTGTTLQQHSVKLAAEAAVAYQPGGEPAWPDITARPVATTATTTPATPTAPAGAGGMKK